jgi:hypothetical protein
VQIIGQSCQVCTTPIAFDADGARCRSCGAVFHDQCRAADRCPICEAAIEGRSSRVFAQHCPACGLATGTSVDLVCRACGARTGWEDADALQRHELDCRAHARVDLWRGAVLLLLPVPLVWLALRLGPGYAVILGLVSLVVAVALFGVAILLSVWSLKSFRSAWRLSRPVRLRATLAD